MMQSTDSPSGSAGNPYASAGRGATSKKGASVPRAPSMPKSASSGKRSRAAPANMHEQHPAEMSHTHVPSSAHVSKGR
jgi:hypothetical protein